VLLHGASLGSSADVFRRNLTPLAEAGFRAIAFDQPGFGLSDVPQDHSAAFRKKVMPKFADALGLRKLALVGHSQAGNPAVQLAQSVGRNFQAFVARTEAAEGPKKADGKPPLWQRLPELAMPLLMIFGRNDRAHAADRAATLQRTYPQLQIHIVDGCKHLVPWDAADE